MAHRRSDKDKKKAMHMKALTEMQSQPCWGEFERIEKVGTKIQSVCGTCECKVECKVEQLKRIENQQPTIRTNRPHSKTAIKKWQTMAVAGMIMAQEGDKSQ